MLLAKFLLLLMFCSFSTSESANSDTDCPVCLRVLRAVRDLSITQSIPLSNAYQKYCSLSSLEVEDQIFCYNTETIQKDIFRLLNLSADEFRICKKIKSVNSDFCKSKFRSNLNSDSKRKEVSYSDSQKQGIILNNRLQRGVIYI
jgi:hypothetical protein